MTLAPLRPAVPADRRADRLDQIERLRARMERMQQPVRGRSMATHPALVDVVSLRAGGVYAVDALSLALTVLAGPSAAGEWGAVIGVPEFGAEAAAELGIALERTVLVPDPAGCWLEATAALVDVAGLVVVRPPEPVRESTAEKMRARLRTRGAALVALCDQPGAAWPRADVRLTATSRWQGLGRGHGFLTERELRIARAGAAMPAQGRDRVIA